MFLSNRCSFRPETSGAYTLRRRGRGRSKSGSAIGACAVARLAGNGGSIGDYHGSANSWLRRGGYPWQDDPYLEEYPYEFAKAGSVEELRGFFAHGNWALRQGIVYEDLAFVQQVDGGDEWWTLKRTDSGWLAFESWSFGRIVQEPERFSHAIECMHRATPEQCKRLEYMEAVPSIEDAARRARDSIQQLNKTAMTPTRGARAELR